MGTLNFWIAVATVVAAVTAFFKATFSGGTVVKAEGDGGSNSGGSGWTPDFDDSDMPF